MFFFRGTRTIHTKDGEDNIKIQGYTTSLKEDLQEVLSNFGIVIVSFYEKQEPLGKLFEVSITYAGKTVNIIFPMVDDNAKIVDAFDVFMKDFAILDIDYIKPYGKDFPKEKLKQILNILKENYITENDSDKEKKKKEKDDSEHLIKEESKVLEFRKDVEDFILEMDEMLPKFMEAYPVGAKDLESILNELKKYRAASNIHKLGEIYKKALEISEPVYEKYFDYLEKKEKKQESGKVITELDIIREYEKYKRIERIKLLEKIDSKELAFPWYETLYYKLLGKYGVNLKLILQEFKEKYNLNYYSFFDILLFFQFLIIFLIIDYFLLFLYKYFALSESLSSLLPLFYTILIISLFGIIVTIGRILSKKSTFLAIIVMIVLYIIFNILKSYFALI